MRESTNRACANDINSRDFFMSRTYISDLIYVSCLAIFSMMKNIDVPSLLGGVIVGVLVMIAFSYVRPRTSGFFGGLFGKKKTLYDRLGGAFAIAGVVDHFSDAILKSPLVGVESPNPYLREWSRSQSATRLPGLKFMRALWVCDLAGGPMKYAGTKPGSRGRFDLSEAHKDLKISSAEFDEVARILKESLVHFKVPPVEVAEVMGAFAAHKKEVVRQ
jgi:hemoglobin